MLLGIQHRDFFKQIIGSVYIRLSLSMGMSSCDVPFVSSGLPEFRWKYLSMGEKQCHQARSVYTKLDLPPVFCDAASTRLWAEIGVQAE